jgi:hypothetical protein
MVGKIAQHHHGRLRNELPNPPFRPSCQLPPAADMPLNWLSYGARGARGNLTYSRNVRVHPRAPFFQFAVRAPPAAKPPRCRARLSIPVVRWCGIFPSLCEGCLVRGRIPRRDQAVFTFGRAGMPVLRPNFNDRSGDQKPRSPSRALLVLSPPENGNSKRPIARRYQDGP